MYRMHIQHVYVFDKYIYIYIYTYIYLLYIYIHFEIQCFYENGYMVEHVHLVHITPEHFVQEFFFLEVAVRMIWRGERLFLSEQINHRKLGELCLNVLTYPLNWCSAGR